MAHFEYTFTVRASQEAVNMFHRDTDVLKHLIPPPLYLKLHHFEPLAEGSRAKFTMWIGPLPLQWRVIHHNVSDQGFTDRQVQGPLARWQHTHRFIPLDGQQTLVRDQIVYEHSAGAAGWLTRLMFNKPGLILLFTYRRLVTTLALERGPYAARLLRGALATGFLVAAAGAILLARTLLHSKQNGRTP